MKNRALQYYRQGYNCSQCILKAVESKYGIPMSKQTQKLLSAVNTGFGIGGICSVLIAGVMAFGLMFNEQTAKRMRMKLFSRFSEKHQSLNCSSLRSGTRDGSCEDIVVYIADLIDTIINEERK